MILTSSTFLAAGIRLVLPQNERGGAPEPELSAAGRELPAAGSAVT